jgi:hypothetical protein
MLVTRPYISIPASSPNSSYHHGLFGVNRHDCLFDGEEVSVWFRELNGEWEVWPWARLPDGSFFPLSSEDVTAVQESIPDWILDQKESSEFDRSHDDSFVD